MIDGSLLRRRWLPIPRTIRGLALVFAIVTVCVTLLLGVVTLVVVHRELERQIDQRISTESEALLDYAQERGFEALAALVAQRDRRSTPGSIGYLVGVDDRSERNVGYILTDSERPPPGRIAQRRNAAPRLERVSSHYSA